MVKNKKIGIVGLGYVGLPLAVEFGKKYFTIGYDIDSKRISELNKKKDFYGEISKVEIKSSKKLTFTNDIYDLKKCNVFIITVPTPIFKNNKPNLTMLRNACVSLSSCLKKRDIVIIESTVYPGATEEICIPIFEKKTKLKFNKDFFLGYSPERINVGDKKKTISKICKITSGSTKKTSLTIDTLYKSIIKAGTFNVSNIKTAETAKVIENVQRDINIAVVNELARFFKLINVDTKEVLDAAATKWNFVNYKPGLVGGHCIGVDPYYLSYKAKKMGFNPKILISGRRTNEGMGDYVAINIKKLLKINKKNIKRSKVLILGLTFKENCKDIRNSKIINVYNKLNTLKIKTYITDPNVNYLHVKKYYKIPFLEYKNLNLKKFDLLIFAVSHSKFKDINIRNIKKSGTLIYDIKSMFPKKYSDERL